LIYRNVASEMTRTRFQAQHHRFRCNAVRIDRYLLDLNQRNQTRGQ